MKVELRLLSSFYEKMLLIRRFEEKVNELITNGVVLGSVHLCIGEEAAAVGTIQALQKEDYMLPTHRGHGQHIAKGADIKKLLAELAGKKTGYCKGNSGSIHVFDKENNNLGSNGIVGAQFPVSLGAGLAIKNKGLKRCVAVFFGDGASNQGWFYEALNIASLWDLPIVFVCINNLYGMGTPYKNTSKAKIPDKAKVFGIPNNSVDGNDVETVYKEMEKTVSYVKKNIKPAMLECITYRWTGHSAFDKRKYRPEGELESWKKKDPIERIEKRLTEKGFKAENINKIKKEVDNRLKEAEEYATESEYPSFTDSMEL